MTMPINGRIAVIARLACILLGQTGQKLGRTQLMKFLYFLQELEGVDLQYEFSLFTYGPFDSDVLSDLAKATSLGVVSEEMVIFPRGYGYHIAPTDKSREISDNIDSIISNASLRVDTIVKEFGQFNAAELELRSTILFVDRELSRLKQPYDSTSLASRVQEIKHHFTAPVIMDRIRSMQSKDWLKCVS